MLIDSIDSLEKMLDDNQLINLYGTGPMSDILFAYLEHKHITAKIATYLLIDVYEKSHNGIPIKSLTNTDTEIKSITCVVVVPNKYHDDIKKEFMKNGYSRYCFIDDHLLRTIHIEIRSELEKQAEKLFWTNHSPLSANRYACGVLLLSVPYWDVYSPFSAIPSLAAKLKLMGVQVKQADLGIETFHKLFAASYDKKRQWLLSYEYYKNKICAYVKNNYDNYEVYKYDMFFLQKKFDLEYVKRIYDKLNTVQQGVFYELIDGILSDEYQEVNFNSDNYDIDKDVNSASWLYLWETLMDKRNSELFISTPKFIGIAATSVNQFPAACKIADIIKTIAPNATIVLGGSAADLFMESLYNHKDKVFDYFDFVVVGEGETAICSLWRYVVDGVGELEDIPNLFYQTNEGVLKFTYSYLEDVESLPLPDYTGLDLSRYFSPKTILPYQASRGCHYGQCAFCNHNEKYRHHYRPKSVMKVVNELRELAFKYHIRDFQFVDEAIRPDQFMMIVAEMKKHQEFSDYRWIYYSRVSREYNATLLRDAYDCGCRMVMLGIETFNGRLLKLIRKGILPEVSNDALKMFHQVGIKTFAWMMCNLPSETLAETRADIDELKNKLAYIDAFAVSMFSLEINTDMYKAPAKFNILSTDMEKTIMFSSHNNRTVIDKNDIINCFSREFLPLIRKYYFSANRYFTYFRQ